MVIQKLEGEKLKGVRAGKDTFCCWGGPGDECDCSAKEGSFAEIYGGWVDNMELKLNNP